MLPQELLQRDEQEFVARIARFTGRSINPGMRGERKAEGRILAPLPPEFRSSGSAIISFPAPSTKAGWGRSKVFGPLFRSLGYRKTPFFSNKAQEFRQLIGNFSGRFAEANRRLQAYCPVDLKALGYEMDE